MKIKHILLSISLLCSIITAKAQVGEYRSQLSVGFSGGMAINRVDFNPTIKQKGFNGPTGGFTLRYTSEKYIKAICAIQLEVNFAQLGWNEDIDPVKDENGNITRQDSYKRKMNHIQVPLLARMGWGREKRGMQFFILAGPQLNYCFSDSEEYNFNPNADDLSQYRASGVTEQYGKPIDNKLEYGITAGMGVELSTSIGHFTIDGRYYYGLGDFYKNSKKDYFNRSANSTICVKLGYLVDL